MKILIVDDDAGLRKSVSMILDEAGYEVVVASDGEEGLAKAREGGIDIILSDVRMPRMTGMEFLERYQESGGDALVIVMTAYGSLELAVEAMKKGAYDYLPKPFGADEVLLTVRKAEEREELRREVGRLRSEVRADRRYGEIVARSPQMIESLELANKVAEHPSSVLITGASGTGKELVARLIHRSSRRASNPFIPVNCGAIPETLLESEFFGYMKGAFSGAEADKEGLFEAADGGTLFLDEVGDLPVGLQVKLLRVLQEGEFRRVGDTTTRSTDVRVLAATNKDLKAEVADGGFREDLYYRLAVVPIHLPPLRERREEVPELVAHFLERHGKRLGIDAKGVDPEAMKMLMAHAWPGNVRELENVLERALVLTEDGRIGKEELPSEIVRGEVTAGPDLATTNDLSVKRRSAELERRLILEALDRTDGNRSKAADLLDLSARALRYKIKDYDIEV